MKKQILKRMIRPMIFTGLLLCGLLTAQSTSTGHIGRPAAVTPAYTGNFMLYDSLDLDSLGLSREAFNYALKGYNHLLSSGRVLNTEVLSIIDFSLPSNKKRLFVIDLKDGKLLFNTLVAHGRNSGLISATTFSNRTDSYKSALGFYITGHTYRGEHGYSLKLLGTEKGINDNALDRGIVMHSAAYVNEKIAAMRGYIGRSLGCPAIPVNLHRKIIEEIKDGTCLFLYGPDKYYTANSRLLLPDNIV